MEYSWIAGRLACAEILLPVESMCAFSSCRNTFVYSLSAAGCTSTCATFSAGSTCTEILLSAESIYVCTLSSVGSFVFLLLLQVLVRISFKPLSVLVRISILTSCRISYADAFC